MTAAPTVNDESGSEEWLQYPVFVASMDGRSVLLFQFILPTSFYFCPSGFNFVLLVLASLLKTTPPRGFLFVGSFCEPPGYLFCWFHASRGNEPPRLFVSFYLLCLLHTLVAEVVGKLNWLLLGALCLRWWEGIMQWASPQLCTVLQVRLSQGVLFCVFWLLFCFVCFVAVYSTACSRFFLFLFDVLVRLSTRQPYTHCCLFWNGSRD